MGKIITPLSFSVDSPVISLTSPGHFAVISRRFPDESLFIPGRFAAHPPSISSSNLPFFPRSFTVNSSLILGGHPRAHSPSIPRSFLVNSPLIIMSSLFISRSFALSFPVNSPLITQQFPIDSPSISR